MGTANYLLKMRARSRSRLSGVEGAPYQPALEPSVSCSPGQTKPVIADDGLSDELFNRQA